MEQNAHLQTIDRALDVLCAFTGAEELGVSEIARHLRLPKSAVHRVVQTLVRRNFMEQRSNRRYRLGVKILELGNISRLRLDLVGRAEPILKHLSVQADANAHLARMDQGEVFDLVRIEYPAPLRITRTPMLRRPAHCTALGKVLLAFGGPKPLDEALERGLSRLTHRTITQPERLLAELERIRDRGYAIDNEEFYAGLRCVAAPVRNEDGEVVAAVSLSALITRLTQDKIPQFTTWVVEAAQEVSYQLGYRPASK